MKKSDIAMIILVASISMITAYFIGKAIFGDVYNGTATVKTINKYDSQVQQPDPEIFNKNAINPSIQVQISGTK